MRAALLVLTLAAPILAGCLAQPAPLQPATVITPALVSAGLAASPDGALRWSGGNLTASGGSCAAFLCTRPTTTCESASNCDRIAFDLDLPADFWATHDGRLEIEVAWAMNGPVTFTTELRDPDGKVLAKGAEGWYGSVVVLDTPRAGAYELLVIASAGSGPYDASLRVSARDRGEARDLLPDLVTLPPTDLNIAFDTPLPVNPFALLAGSKGCRPDEAFEAQAKRCLRLTNRVGNAGDGPLEVRLALTEGVGAFAGQGRYVQRIYRTDGTFHDDPVGPAVFHPIHGHFHYAGLAHYTVYPYDLATGTRGAALNEGKKSGFCFEDSGLLGLGLPFTAVPSYSGRGCFDPTQTQEWFMGIGAKWFDEYNESLADQFVDISGAPDGVYELVSEANSAGTLLETDPADNGASVRFRLTGDRVETLPGP